MRSDGTRREHKRESLRERKHATGAVVITILNYDMDQPQPSCPTGMRERKSERVSIVALNIFKELKNKYKEKKYTYIT